MLSYNIEAFIWIFCKIWRGTREIYKILHLFYNHSLNEFYHILSKVFQYQIQDNLNKLMKVRVNMANEHLIVFTYVFWILHFTFRETLPNKLVDNDLLCTTNKLFCNAVDFCVNYDAYWFLKVGVTDGSNHKVSFLFCISTVITRIYIF